MKNNQRGNVLAIIPILILLVGLGLGVYLVQTKQLFQPKAGGGPITPVGSNISQLNGVWQTSGFDIEVELHSSLGPPPPISPVQTDYGANIPIVKVTPSRVSIGKSILVTWNNMPINSTDPGFNFIVLEGPQGYWVNQYTNTCDSKINTAYTPRSSGQCYYTVPRTPGKYLIHFFANTQDTIWTRNSNSVEVIP